MRVTSATTVHCGIIVEPDRSDRSSRELSRVPSGRWALQAELGLEQKEIKAKCSKGRSCVPVSVGWMMGA